MAGTMIEFAANGRQVPGWYVPAAGGTGPGLVVIQEWWGLVGHIKDVAERFAAAGFTVLAPDLYHGQATTSPDAAGKLMMALNIAEAAADIRGAAAYLLAQPATSSARVGVLGFCMGGQLALYAGLAHPDVFGAVVDFYGIHPNAPVQPADARIPVLGHFGVHDASVPLEQVHALFDGLRAAGVEAVAHEYDAGHAFFNDARPQVYAKAEAELAWSRSVEFLRRHLG
jgi:carboxymethylenebutenolidase